MYSMFIAALLAMFPTGHPNILHLMTTPIVLHPHYSLIKIVHTWGHMGWFERVAGVGEGRRECDVILFQVKTYLKNKKKNNNNTPNC